MNAAGVDGNAGAGGGTDRDERRRPAARDRARIRWAVLRLDLWQSWYAVPGRIGRAMQRELSANLQDAEDEPGGVAGAVQRLGSLRELAREAVVDSGRVRWERGATAAVAAFAAVLLGQMLLSFVYANGLLAAGGGQGSLFGIEVSARDNAESHTVSATLGGWLLLVVPLVFVLVARPWRLLRRAPSA